MKKPLQKFKCIWYSNQFADMNKDKNEDDDRMKFTNPNPNPEKKHAPKKGKW